MSGWWISTWLGEGPMYTCYLQGEWLRADKMGD